MGRIATANLAGLFGFWAWCWIFTLPPATVPAAAQRYIDQAGGGFLLGSGCIVPRYGPLANVQAMVRVAHHRPYPA